MLLISHLLLLLILLKAMLFLRRSLGRNKFRRELHLTKTHQSQTGRRWAAQRVGSEKGRGEASTVFGRDSRLDRRAQRVGHIGRGRGGVRQRLGPLSARAALHVLMARVELVDVVERGP